MVWQFLKGNFYCSYDARAGGPDKGHRWSDEERGFGKRANFQLHRHPSVLHIENIKAEEAGIYRCRVDFKTSPTRNSLLNLSVISKFYNFKAKMSQLLALLYFTDPTDIYIMLN